MMVLAAIVLIGGIAYEPYSRLVDRGKGFPQWSSIWNDIGVRDQCDGDDIAGLGGTDVCLDETFTPICLLAIQSTSETFATASAEGQGGLGAGTLRDADASSGRGEGGAGGANCWPFPAGECATLLRIAECESGNGTNPAAYDVEAENGGIWQINRDTWKNYFWETYGWHWATVVQDDNLNRVAAYIIWQRSGWSAWACW